MLKLKPDPRFSAPVLVPVPGADAVEIQLRFRYKTRTELADYSARAAKAHGNGSDLELLLEVVDGWERAVVDEAGNAVPFSREALAALIDAYPGAVLAVLRSYFAAHNEARAKN